MWTSNQANARRPTSRPAAACPTTTSRRSCRRACPAPTVTDPTVTVAPRFGDPTMGYEVVITIFWQPPGDVQHNYQTGATVKLN